MRMSINMFTVIYLKFYMLFVMEGFKIPKCGKQILIVQMIYKTYTGKLVHSNCFVNHFLDIYDSIKKSFKK